LGEQRAQWVRQPEPGVELVQWVRQKLLWN
jgi:hypothetical protein